MANRSAPAHDFAPAWLKIPSYDNIRPSGADNERGGHTSRRDEHWLGFNKREKDNILGSQQVYPDNRRERDTTSGERKSSYFPSRHHSIDFDDTQLPPGGGNVRLFGSNGSGGPLANTQSSLLRRPHSRHDFRDIPTSYSKLNPSGHYGESAGTGFYGNKGKGKPLETMNSSNCSSDARGITVSSNKFNQEFPSLQGDINEEPSTPPPTLNGGVWEKARSLKVSGTGVVKKIHLIKRPVKCEISNENRSKSPSITSPSSAVGGSSSSSNSSSHTVIVTPVTKGNSSSAIYRALVPAKYTVPKKSNREGLKLSSKKSSPSTPPPLSQTMEILVKNPKAPGNKSDFLKALRNENKGEDINGDDGKGDVQNSNKLSQPDVEENHVKDEIDESHMNGIDISKLSVDGTDDKSILSSSLEAEQRLLKEMGWKEEGSDDDAYAPLTEDELREYKDLTQKIAQRNGIKRNIQMNWSPRRIPPFTSVVPPPDTWTSSSESDSDF